MLSYLQELEITPYLLKSSLKKNVDVCLILKKPETVELANLFNNLSSSFKIINNQLRFEVMYCNTQEGKTEDIMLKLKEFNFKKVIIFGDITNINLDIIARDNSLEHKDILQADDLKTLSQDVNLKKQLWQNLKTFLVNNIR